MADACAVGHTREAMECPACCGSTDLAWWRWYRSRTSSRTVKALVAGRIAEMEEAARGHPAS